MALLTGSGPMQYITQLCPGPRSRPTGSRSWQGRQFGCVPVPGRDRPGPGVGWVGDSLPSSEHYHWLPYPLPRLVNPRSRAPIVAVGETNNTRHHSFYNTFNLNQTIRPPVVTVLSQLGSYEDIMLIMSTPTLHTTFLRRYNVY